MMVPAPFSQLRGRLVLLAACAIGPLSVIPAAPGAEEMHDANYRLSLDDLVEVTVFQEDELKAAQRIDPQGEIRLPLLGNVALAGKTIREAQEYLEGLFVERKFLRRPMVTIRVTEYSSRQVFVFGAVAKAGAVEFPAGKPQLSILDVIARCGGFLPNAREDTVSVTRKKPDGSSEVIEVNVAAMIAPKQAQVEQFLVQPGDVINVDERRFPF